MRDILQAAASVFIMTLGFAWGTGHGGVLKASGLSAAERRAPQTVRFKTFTVVDDMLKLPAVQMLVPADWEAQAKVLWRFHPQYPTTITARIYNPKGREELNILPDVPYADGVFFPEGSNYLGNEVRRLIADPAQYVTQIAVPRFRPQLLKAAVVGSEELPKLAEAAAATFGNLPGLQARAARVRFEYEEAGHPVQEDVFCVLVILRAGNITFWGSDGVVACTADKGELDGWLKIFETIVYSAKTQPAWFNAVTQIKEFLTQSASQQSQQAVELSKYLSHVNSQISDTIRQAYEQHVAATDRIHENFDMYIRGVQRYQDPFQNRVVELPAGYQNAWTNQAGEYIVSNDANFNPNVGSTRQWQQLGQAH
jgi:hypothetical protein